ncbi:hypothetical protein [Streptomyces sp. ITFR-16]|uniref:hypothetical protein n=1 Tax=Streptomyces sp. ITFR-16 TaxID=3075198 RepID=UPI00288B9E88|nr:hypothetical protein [Streptomyces sp. ITFR-16]WNI23491.1 hypothetical protein RLT58_16875 [Streptomyces sp. ITFR-16]
MRWPSFTSFSRTSLPRSWRYRSYASDLPWARDKLRDLLDEEPAGVPNPEYVLSLYWLTSGPWSGDAHDTALRLLSTPSVLVDRGAPDGPAPLGGTVEESLLRARAR